MQISTTCVGRSENLDRTLENLYLLYRGRLLRAGDAARLLDRIETLLPYLLGDRPKRYLELVISFSYSFGYLLGFFNVARRGSDSEGNLWSQDHSQPLYAEQDLLSTNHKIRGSYYGMCPEFLFTLSKLMSLLSEVDDPSTIDPNVIQ